MPLATFMYDKDQQKKQKLKLVCPVKLHNTPLSRNQIGNSCKSGGTGAHLTIYFICRASPDRQSGFARQALVEPRAFQFHRIQLRERMVCEEEDEKREALKKSQQSTSTL